jgi:2-isopropylmalate synthase
MEAVDLGVNQIHATVNGFGERAGNADMCQLLPNLELKKGIKLKVRMKNIRKLSDMVYTLANIKPNNNQPYVGRNAFRHKGGVHVDAVAKGASYEHIDPTKVGNSRDTVLSNLSGKANIVEVVKKFWITVKKDNPKVSEMLKRVEKLEKEGYNIGNLHAEQIMISNEFFGRKKEFFKINTWKVSSEQRNGEFSESVITGTVDGKPREVVAPVLGGPVEALYNSLQKMIATNYKGIKSVKLINYKVMIAVDKGAESSVRVYIEFRNGKEEWGTVGVSPNILEASLEAIEKGFRYFMLRHHL